MIQGREGEDSDRSDRSDRSDQHSRDDSAVWTELGLVESILTVFSHQVVWMWTERLALRHQVDADFSFTRVIQNLHTEQTERLHRTSPSSGDDGSGF